MPKRRVVKLPGSRLMKESGAKQGRFGETAYQVLRRAIVDGDLPPGERLREEYLSKSLEVSRTPVREALKRLEAEGLVIAQARHGVVVRAHSVEQTIEIYFLREVLDSVAARLAAERANETELAQLDSLVHDLERETATRNYDRLDELSRRFHEVLWRASGNGRLVEILEGLQSSVRRFERSTLEYAGQLDKALGEHRLLAEAVRNRDSVEAERIAREHMRRIRNIRVAMSVAVGSPEHAVGRMRTS